MEKPTEIYRFGHYVNTVPDNKDSLRQWIMDNCSYERCEGAIPPTMTLLECIKIARERGYTFTSKVTDSISEQAVARLTKILAYAKFPEVATDLARCKRKGKNLVCSCPNCETGGSVLILPAHQTYRCFTCGETGNVVSFVMSFLKMDYDTALDYLETKYVK